MGVVFMNSRFEALNFLYKINEFYIVSGTFFILNIVALLFNNWSNFFLFTYIITVSILIYISHYYMLMSSKKINIMRLLMYACVLYIPILLIDTTIKVSSYGFYILIINVFFLFVVQFHAIKKGLYFKKEN